MAKVGRVSGLVAAQAGAIVPLHKMPEEFRADVREAFRLIATGQSGMPLAGLHALLLREYGPDSAWAKTGKPPFRVGPTALRNYLGAYEPELNAQFVARRS